LNRTSQDSIRVCAFGTFDIIHLGHLRYLEEAKKLGGPNAELVVVVARDSSVARFKAEPPVFPEKHRVALVAGLKPVDHAVLGHEGPDKFAIIVELQPQILAIGYDQWVNIPQLKEELHRRSLENIEITRLPEVKDELGSSTSIKKRIAAKTNQKLGK
jgi:FAD synthetase